MKKLIIILFALQLVTCDVHIEAASCTTKKNEIGVCKLSSDCEYAVNRGRSLETAEVCAVEGDKMYVCCVEPPTEPLSDREVEILQQEGLLQSDDIKCGYNGTQPINCRRVVHDFTTLRFNEPPQCPELEKPYAREYLSHHQSVIYDACYAYSRLGSKCLVNDGNPGSYLRDDCQRFRSISKISDGDPAMAKEFPHMAVLGGKGKTTKDIVWFAVGSLISEYFILTAAHAVGSRDVGPVKYALLGTLYRNDTRSGQLYHIVEIIRHPEFSFRTIKNDIALIKVHTRVMFSDFIRPACLTFPGTKEYEYRSSTVAGWGNMGSGKGVSDVLLKATVYQEHDHRKCTAYFTHRFFVWDSETMICAKSEAKPPNLSCLGDSGGPLMTMSKRYVPCSYFVKGIKSWWSFCGQQLYGPYTNASYDKYQEWIVENVWPLQLNARTNKLS